MNTIRYTLEFTRATDAEGVRVVPRDTRVVAPPAWSVPPAVVSVVLPKEDATFEKAVEYAQGLLPQGPVWKAPRLVSAIESDD